MSYVNEDGTNQGRLLFEGLTSLNVSIVKFYDFYSFKYIYWKIPSNNFQYILDEYTLLKQNVICSKSPFPFICQSEHYKTLKKHSFCIGYSDILSKFPIFIYPRFFTGKVLGVLTVFF